jgi:hypothetical protein
MHRDQQMPARIEFAWRCHTAQENWTSKVDTKASIFLTANLIGLAALLSARSSADSPLSAPDGWSRLAMDGGILLAGLAALVTMVVVFPLLGRPQRRTYPDIIYFGHLKDQAAVDVAQRIATLTAQEQIDQLARQLVAMAKGNWIKYRVLQLALLLAISGYTVVGLSVLPNS